MTQRRLSRLDAMWVVGLWSTSFVLFGVFFLPYTVDAVAYLAGVGGGGTFTATNTRLSCAANYPYGATCTQVTDGYLDPGHLPASVEGQVQGSFPVRRPVWVWGIIGPPLFNPGEAILDTLVFGCLQLALAGSVPFMAHRGYRAWRSARTGHTGGRPAAAVAAACVEAVPDFFLLLLHEPARRLWRSQRPRSADTKWMLPGHAWRRRR
jgi:hypothetical protein